MRDLTGGRLPVKQKASLDIALKKAINRSLIGHAIVVLFVFVIFPLIHSSVDYAPTRIVMVDLPRGTGDNLTGLKKVDRLPETTVQEQETLPMAQKPEEAKLEKQEKPNTETKPKTENPNAMKEISKKEKKPAPKEKKPSVVSNDMRAALNKIGKSLDERRIVPETAQSKDNGDGYIYGTSDKPLRVPPDDPEYLRYQAQVRAKILKEWIVPAHLQGLPQGSRPRAKIIVYIDKIGTVTTTEFDTKSGVELLDVSALRAIERASPLPPPPERLKWEAYKEGFLVDFMPQ